MAARIRLPRRKDGEQFALATQLVGGDQIRAVAEDGEERSCRIPGKMRKRVWIRVGDVIIIRAWDFQPSKADVVWRYLRFQKEHLKKRGLLQKLPLEEE